MKYPSIEKKSRRAVLAVLVTGCILAAGIVLTKGEHSGAPTPAAAGGEHGEAGHGKASGKDEHSADSAKGEPAGHGEHADEGIVKLSDAQIEGAAITIVKAAPAMIGTVSQLPGEIRFNEDRTAHIVPRLAGVVESVKVNLGERVKRGQPLAVIASSELAEMRSELLAAQKRQGLAQLTYSREKKLWQDKISAEQDYLQAQQVLRETEIAVQNARQKLEAFGAAASNGDALNSFTLRAPFDGIIVEKHLSLGEAVKEDVNIFTLSDLSTVWAEISVSAGDLNVVRVGEKATVKATSLDSVATGAVVYVGSLLGEQTRSAKARVTLSNPSMAWRPGMFVTVELVRGAQQVPVAVRADALQTVENRTVIFAKTDGGFKALPIKTGRNDGKFVEVVEGLEAGTSYAASGSFVLKAEQGKGSADHDH